ncbi:hypothetical protein [Reichenbachiella agariperforans]|uniref:hypothetical protein n=1 Tax=Reichenbachiella agariperforans TaxID=156994 RepID=UPI0009329965|nr:hypothetical protein [Reichenbachiella agariperforans]
MFKSKLPFVVIFISLTALSSACKVKDSIEDDLFGCNGYDTEINSLLEELTAAQTAYTNDPTTSTCNSYVSAMDTYVTEVYEYLDCIPGAQKQAYRDGLDQWNTSLDETRDSCDAL